MNASVLDRLKALALALAIGAASCTTYVRPVECGGRPFRCGERHDVSFCENIATAVRGADCAKVGLAAGQPFCFVAAKRCVSTDYALKDADCVVVSYRPVREAHECSPGTPTFEP